MSKKYERKDWTGDTYWIDENGRRTYEKKDWSGDTYYEDENGNKTYEKKDWSDNTYWVDDKGNKTYEKKDWSGDTYWIDEKGNKTCEKKDFMGNRYTVSNNGETAFPGHKQTDDYKKLAKEKARGGGSGGLGCSGYLMAYLLIIGVLMGVIAFIAAGIFHVELNNIFIKNVFAYLVYGSIGLAIVFVIAFLIIPVIKNAFGIIGLLIFALLICAGPVLVYLSLDTEQKNSIKASITIHLNKEKNQGQTTKIISPRR